MSDANKKAVIDDMTKDMYKFVEKYNLYSNSQKEELEKDTKGLLTLYKDVSISKECFLTLKAYIVRKAKEKAVIENYFNMLDNGIRQISEGVSERIMNAPDEIKGVCLDEFRLLDINDKGERVPYEHFNADKMMPFLMEKINDYLKADN